MKNIFLLILFLAQIATAQNLKVSQLTPLLNSSVASNDLTLVVDTSASTSKSMTFGELDLRWAPFASPAFTGTVTAEDVLIGNPGAESTGISIDGTLYNSTFKVSDINGSNYAQTILHRHSTVLEPLIVGARSNTDTSSHANVTASQNLFSIYGAGWADNDYKLFGSLNIAASASGTISNTSSPGKIVFSVTPNGSKVPAAAMTIESSKDVTFAGGIIAPTLDLTTPLPLAEGGSAKALTASAGAIAFSDADSLEFTGVGSNGQFLRSAGTGTPTWSSTLVSPTSSGDLTLSNGGIKFPATQYAVADANTLDDYERGTYTPTYNGTTPGTTTYIAQTGVYTKIGKTVFFYQYVAWTNTTASGTIVMSGLPFTSKSAALYYSCLAVYNSSHAVGASSTIQGFIASGSTSFTVTQTTPTAGSDSAVAVDSAGGLLFQGHYTTD